MIKGFVVFTKKRGFYDYGSIHIFEHYVILKIRKILDPKNKVKIFGETSSAYLLFWWETNIKSIVSEIQRLINLIYEGKLEFDNEVYLESIKEVNEEILNRGQDILIYQKYCELLHGNCLGSPIGIHNNIADWLKLRFTNIKKELEYPTYYFFTDNVESNYFVLNKIKSLSQHKNLTIFKTNHLLEAEDAKLPSRIRLFTPLFTVLNMKNNLEDYNWKLKAGLLISMSELIFYKILKKYNLDECYLGGGKIILDGIPYLITDIYE